MPCSSPRFSFEEFRLFDDALHRALSKLEDMQYGPWYLLRKRNPTTVNRLKAWIFLLIDELLHNTIKLPKAEENVLDFHDINRRQRVGCCLMRYIDANINGDLSLKNLAELAGLSGRQIQRIFKELTGDSCHKYVMGKRVEKGRALMQKDPGHSIKEIAYSCGFSSPAHFSVAF